MFCSGGDRAIFAQAEIVGKSAPTPVALWGSPSDGVEWSGVHRGFPYVINRREPHARSPQKDASQKAFTLAIDRAPRTGTLLRSTRDWESTGKGSTGLEGGRCWVNKIRSLWRRKSAGVCGVYVRACHPPVDTTGCRQPQPGCCEVDYYVLRNHARSRLVRAVQRSKRTRGAADDAVFIGNHQNHVFLLLLQVKNAVAVVWMNRYGLSIFPKMFLALTDLRS
eukprot:gene22580-biopygen8771